MINSNKEHQRLSLFLSFDYNEVKVIHQASSLAYSKDSEGFAGIDGSNIESHPLAHCGLYSQVYGYGCSIQAHSDYQSILALRTKMNSE